MTILVTGTSGFLGKHVLNQLLNDFDHSEILVAKSQRNSQNSILLQNSTEFWAIDADSHKLEQVDTIVHIGSYTPKAKNLDLQYEESLKSIVSTSQLIKLSLPNLKRFLYISTMDVYSKDQGGISSDSKVEITNGYTAMKLYCEGLLREHYSQSDVTLTVLRSGHLFGPGDEKYKKILPTLLNASLSDGIFTLGTSWDQQLNLLFVTDAAKIISSLIRSDYRPEMVNLISNSPINLKTIIQEVETISGKKLNVNSVNISLNQFNYDYAPSSLQSNLNISETPFREALLETYLHQKQL